MDNKTNNYYEEIYDKISRVLIWIELFPVPFTVICSVSWIIIAILLLRKRESINTNAFHFESLRVHYLTALHRQRLVQYVILLIAVNCTLTDVILTVRTSFQTYLILNNSYNNNNNNNNTYQLEHGQWSNYNQYPWLVIAWFVPTMTFSQGYYWSVALLPITTKAYFNINTSCKHFVAVLVLITLRGALIAVLWLIPYTIPIGIVVCVLSLAFDWFLIQYFFITAYSVAKNKTKALLEGLDERDGIDSAFIPKLRFLFLTFCLVLTLTFVSMLQAMLVEYVLPMVIYPNCWLKQLYGISIPMTEYWDVGEKHIATFSLIQLVSKLEVRTAIVLCRGVYLILSVVSFVFILKFKLKQRDGKKLKKKRFPKESTPLLKD